MSKPVLPSPFLTLPTGFLADSNSKATLADTDIGCCDENELSLEERVEMQQRLESGDRLRAIGRS